MLRVLGLVMLLVLLLSSCTQKLICPAYQSAFIYDQEALRKKFSYFKEDSTPKILTVSKNRYLMIPEKSYRQKIRSLKTIEMKPVYTVIPDSLKAGYKNPEDEFKGAEQDSAAVDSTAAKKPEADSSYQISKDKEVRVLKYNRDSAKYHIEHIRLNADQDNYMWYFRDQLVLPDVRAALEDQKKAKEEKAKVEKKKKGGFFGFFKNMFKKKAKTDSIPAGPPPPPPVDSDDPADSTAALEAVPVVAPPPPEKKSFFKSLFKKKPKKAKKKEEPAEEVKPEEKKPEKDPAKKEGDGFE